MAAPGAGPIGAGLTTASYERHRPEETVLYTTLQAHWKTFFEELDAAAETPALPAFVVAEVEAFLRCGILAHGFVLARCRDCGWCRPVAFSCRRRGFCSSCIGRRMSDFAPHLVDCVIPRCPVRQWVLTVPYSLRARMMFDPALTTVVLRELIAAVSSWLRRRARRLGVKGVLKTGAVTVIQRFNSALGASPHFHTLFLDGVYSFTLDRAPVFHPTPRPTDEDVALVAASVFRRVTRKLAGGEPSPAHQDFIETAPLLAAISQAAVGGASATGSRRGQRVVRVRGAPATVDAFLLGRLCAEVEGFNLQAASRVAANDREGLERLGRYLARPPVAANRLTRLDDGRLELQLKRPWRDGTTSFVFTPHELIERLVALVPRPRAHLTRYFGVFAPAFAARAGIVPAIVPAAPRLPAGSDGGVARAQPRRRRFPWASMIWRVFLNDVLECMRCRERMEIVAALTHAIERVLGHLGLPLAAPELHPARPPPQMEMTFGHDPSGFYPDPPPPDDFAAERSHGDK